MYLPNAAVQMQRQWSCSEYLYDLPVVLADHLICVKDQLPTNIAVSDFMRHIQRDVGRTLGEVVSLQQPAFSDQETRWHMAASTKVRPTQSVQSTGVSGCLFNPCTGQRLSNPVNVQWAGTILSSDSSLLCLETGLIESGV